MDAEGVTWRVKQNAKHLTTKTADCAKADGSKFNFATLIQNQMFH